MWVPVGSGGVSQSSFPATAVTPSNLALTPVATVFTVVLMKGFHR